MSVSLDGRRVVARLDRADSGFCFAGCSAGPHPPRRSNARASPSAALFHPHSQDSSRSKRRAAYDLSRTVVMQRNARRSAGLGSTSASAKQAAALAPCDTRRRHLFTTPYVKCFPGAEARPTGTGCYSAERVLRFKEALVCCQANRIAGRASLQLMPPDSCRQMPCSTFSASGQNPDTPRAASSPI